MRWFASFLLACGFLASDVTTARPDEPNDPVALKGHDKYVMSIAFSPDSQWLASASADNTVKLWSVSSGTERATLTGHSAEVVTVAFAPDGKTLASAGLDQTIRLWDPATGKERAVFKGDPPYSIRSVAFAPDGKTLAAASQRKAGTVKWIATAHLWDVTAGKERAALEASDGHGCAVAFAPDGKTLALAAQDYPLTGDLTLWDVETLKLRTTFKEYGVDWAAFSPDGKVLAAACPAGVPERKNIHALRLWDLASGKQLHLLRHEWRVYCVAFSADSRVVAAGSEGGELTLWDAATGKELASLPQTSYVHAVAFAPDGKRLAAATHDGVVRLWELTKVLGRKSK
jgi:WD40 repeat protein